MDNPVRRGDRFYSVVVCSAAGYLLPPSQSTHTQLHAQGSFEGREQPLKRDYLERAFTVGIGGPVGSGKTALMFALCRALRHDYSIAAVRAGI